MKRFDYCVFFENGTKEYFWLSYGPEGDNLERLISDYKNNEHMQRFNEETNGEAFKILDELSAERSFAFILVNPPVDVEDEY